MCSASRDGCSASRDECVVCSASRDGMILYNDVRKPHHVVASSYYHKLEVCGLDWSPDGTKLASGANDNMVCVWNASNSKDPEQVLQGHTAAVKVRMRRANIAL